MNAFRWGGSCSPRMRRPGRQMDKRTEKKLRDRAYWLGESRDAKALPELLELLNAPSAQVRRLSASALGKLAGLVPVEEVLPALTERLRDTHPQARQYAVKALSSYGTAAKPALHDLRDMVENPTEKDYNRRDATKAIEIIEEATLVAHNESQPRCQKCNQGVTTDEYARSMRAFQRVYCDNCFNEVYLHRRNWDTKVELNKTIQAEKGQWVQSDGERIIANFLDEQEISYRYDERYQIVDGYAIRPDFYLPEFDLYIEYWGMDTTAYKIGMLKKQKIYQQQGKKMISLYREDKARLRQVLKKKLCRYMCLDYDKA